MTPNELSYHQAIEEIEEILSQIENQELDVDVLGVNLKRVVAVIKICNKKLHSANKQIEQIFREMET